MREVNQYVSEPTVSVPVGMMVIYAGSTAPTGWLFCDGTGYATTAYPALYAVIGTTYGSTSGFQVPDLRDRIPVGAGGTATGALGSELGLGRAIGSTGGVDSVTLTAAQSGMQAHTHTYTDYYKTITSTIGKGGTAVTTSTQTEVERDTTGNPSDASAVASHGNLMPFIVINFIIKAY